MIPLERTDMHLLERPLACWILLYVRAHPGCRASEVYESSGVYSTHDRTRVNQLAKTCLLQIHYDFDTQDTTLRLTEGGQRVADALEAVREALLEHRERVCAEVGE